MTTGGPQRQSLVNSVQITDLKISICWTTTVMNTVITLSVAPAAGSLKRNDPDSMTKKYKNGNWSVWKHLWRQQGRNRSWCFCIILPDTRGMNALRSWHCSPNMRCDAVFTVICMAEVISLPWKVCGTMWISSFVLQITSVLSHLRFLIKKFQKKCGHLTFFLLE